MIYCIFLQRRWSPRRPRSNQQQLPESRELHLGGRHLGRPVGRFSRRQRLLLLQADSSEQQQPAERSLSQPGLQSLEDDDDDC